MTTDEDVKKVLSYLREREIVHFQRFGEPRQEDCRKRLMTALLLDVIAP